MDFDIIIENTGQAELVVIPLEDEYDFTVLSYVGAEPASDDLIDDGLINWADITEQLGDLMPGGIHTIHVHFELVYSASGLEIENIATSEDAEDQYGRLLDGDDIATLTLECTDVSINATDLSFDPPQAEPGDLVTIYAKATNTGEYEILSGTMTFAFEATPLDPSDDPNLSIIGIENIGALAAGESIILSVVWDTTDQPITGIPIYVTIADIQPEECVETNNTTSVIYTVPVTLADFMAISGDGQVTLQWTTETEIELFGWRIFRSERYDNGFQRLNEQIVPGYGTSFVRHDYEYIDSSVENGELYFYSLESVDLDGEMDRSYVVAANPGEGLDNEPRLRLRTGRGIYTPGQVLRLDAEVTAGNSDRSVAVGIWLLLGNEVLGTVVPMTDVEVPAGFTGHGTVREQTLPTNTPEGDFAFFSLMTQQESGLVLSTSVTEFRCVTE